jgi:hypothetical protein
MERLRYLMLLLGLAAVLATSGCIIEDDYDDEPDVDVDVDPPVIEDDPDIIVTPPPKDDPDIIITPPPTTSGGQ